MNEIIQKGKTNLGLIRFVKSKFNFIKNICKKKIKIENFYCFYGFFFYLEKPFYYCREFSEAFALSISSP